MSQRPPKPTRKQRFIAEHPLCCFCGGKAKSVELDHVPPQACFPKDLVPDGIEFPACKACNEVSRTYDQVFGYHAMLLDHDLGNLNIGRAHGLHHGLRNNVSEAIPEFNPSTKTIRKYIKQHSIPRTPGLLLRDEPIVKGMVLVSTEFGSAASMIGRKLGCALYYQKNEKVLPRTHRIHTDWHQMQSSSTEDLTRYLHEVLTNLKVGTKANVKLYGDRLTIRTGENEEGLFGYAAQFGQGLIVWGVIAEAGVLDDTLMLGETWPVFDGDEAHCA